MTLDIYKKRSKKIIEFMNDRTSSSLIVKKILRKVFPDHWSFMLGEVALYAFLVLLLSGVFLTFFFNASMAETHYYGSYKPLYGLKMSAAYESALRISFEIKCGLFMRQLHHWSALLFLASISLHMLRIFFTGAFRKPRELNWIVGILLLILSMGEGFTGYSLPDDLLSGNGLRIIDGVLKSIPLFGTKITFLLFGDEFPGNIIISRLYVIHILLLPSIILLLIIIHMTMIILHRHTQFPGPGRTNSNIVGYPLGPTYIAKAGGFFFIILGVLSLISGIAQINPIWIYGPYDPSPVSAGTQPDWYIGWVDGALRLMPGLFEYTIFGYTLSLNIFLPAIFMISIVFFILIFYPWIENVFTKNSIHCKEEYHLLDRPRNNQNRTAIGVSGIIFYSILWIAASSDLIATHFSISLNSIIYFLRYMILIAPILGFFLTKHLALSLQKKDIEKLKYGIRTGCINKLSNGKYVEKYNNLNKYEKYSICCSLKNGETKQK